MSSGAFNADPFSFPINLDNTRPLIALIPPRRASLCHNNLSCPCDRLTPVGGEGSVACSEESGDFQVE